MKKKSDRRSGGGVWVSQALIRALNGDSAAMLLLGQILYWCELGEDGQPLRLTLYHDDEYWLAKRHADWWEECGVQERTARRKIAQFEAAGIIKLEYHFYGGVKQTYIRVLWSALEGWLESATNLDYS